MKLFTSKLFLCILTSASINIPATHAFLAMPKHGIPPTISTRSNNIDSSMMPVISTHNKVTALNAMVLPPCYCDLIISAAASAGDVVTISSTSTTCTASSMLVSSLTDTIFTPDSIKGAFNVATFLPQPFWLLPILLPKADITKKLFGDIKVITLF